LGVVTFCPCRFSTSRFPFFSGGHRWLFRSLSRELRCWPSLQVGFPSQKNLCGFSEVLSPSVDAAWTLFTLVDVFGFETSSRARSWRSFFPCCLFLGHGPLRLRLFTARRRVSFFLAEPVRHSLVIHFSGKFFSFDMEAGLNLRRPFLFSRFLKSGAPSSS